LNNPESDNVKNVFMYSEERAALCVIIDYENGRQANSFQPDAPDVGVFAVFPADSDDQAIVDAMAPAVFGERYEDGQEITGEVEGCIVAGTVVVKPDDNEPDDCCEFFKGGTGTPH